MLWGRGVLGPTGPDQPPIYGSMDSKSRYPLDHGRIKGDRPLKGLTPTHGPLPFHGATHDVRGKVSRIPYKVPPDSTCYGAEGSRDFRGLDLPPIYCS